MQPTFLDIPFDSSVTFQDDQRQTNDDEIDPPLLEELGIEPKEFLMRLISVLNPSAKANADLWMDGDMSGFILFGFALSFLLLLKGKIHFGYIFGLSVIGGFMVYFLIDMMSQGGSITAYNAYSVLGFCLFPLMLLALLSLFMKLSGVFGIICTILICGWCTISASLTFVEMMGQKELLALISYPLFLFFLTFALNTLF
ncbi:putative Yip1 domain protein [Monocercomonoides exilis]|uniref:putative Yip1 domain protein n=1 Tax=Monocercomonoides exilis TaxID=2049356 RepID=UPI00355A0812|nr:putative Yip1 domain protein [Monocercomonoides exilis]|eukprot:MONOS_14156.1-p1 / transcript=MONOS_14156.1 / gene=MONOS_14156 / organism=Monocercomonoides_exilis_PA203 / gene_product=Yip1 domain protein / transcript_product=Yip1 domain protein / location=Mono_scaffold00948:6593-7354(+) / protein_length=198 / sequence_SO=supercontig / SO=protein_coding / is_pseudo=false